MELTLPLSPITWKTCWRIIPSQFPPINLFERVAAKEDFDILYALEALTNDRLRQEIGNLNLIPEEERIYGDGSGYIMAAFTHLNPEGSRFSDGTWGVYYAAHDLDTAISETTYHRERFMQATNLPPMHLPMRVLTARIEGLLHDLRDTSVEDSSLYSPSSYSASQSLARELKRLDSNGVVYWSLRQAKGQNVAIFRPRILSNCTQERHLDYIWNGHEIANIFEKRLWQKQVK